MGEFSKWLLHDDQKELFDYLYAVILNAAFLAVSALLLWPLGHAIIVLRLAKGYWIFWTVLIITASLLALAQRIFRIDLYSHFDAYVISALVLSGFLQVGWSAFAAFVIDQSIISAPTWKVILVYVIGFISSFVASVIVAAFYMGSLYRMVNVTLALVSFIVFSIWASAGGAIYGWFFNLF